MEREINVFRGGKLIKMITRSPRMGENGLEVTYKGKSYQLFNEDSIETATAVKPLKHEVSTGANTPAPRSDEQTGPDRRQDLPNDEDWNDAQRTVIEGRAEARMIVEAAPGTGKTAVACARIAYLLREGIPADKIWMISFTRTAVQEIRDRVRSLARNDDEVSGVRISTLDSTAWQLRQGFDSASDAMKTGFTDGIHATIEILRSENSDLNEAVADFAHLVIDEAQDIVRERTALVTELLKRLDPSCGVTILCDSAQAIYGFGEDDDDENVEPESETLVSRLKQDRRAGFTFHELSEVIRTADPMLCSLFVDTRRLVLADDASFADVRESIENLAHGKVSSSLEHNGITGCTEVLALFRRRSEVLSNGSFFASKGNPFRLRLSGFPVRLAPWLARVFGDWPHNQITRSRFIERFEAAVGEDVSVPVAEDAWMLIFRHAGVTRELVDLRTLREKLARPQPPI
ncbi:MAG: UvrD-helicase domain-containing protein, partial [Pseudomonadota bacterium]